MQIDGWTLLLQAINLAVLLVLLRWLLYKPLMAVIDQRQQRINEALAAAQRELEQAEAERQALAAQHAQAQASRDDWLQSARESAEAERQTLLSQAQTEAQSEQNQARARMAQEREQAEELMVEEAASLAVDLAGKLLAGSPRPPADADFAEALLSQWAAAPEATRQRMAGSAQPVCVTLVCASAPDETTLDRARERLAQSLGRPVELQGQAQANLLRGAELHFEHGVLSHSWAADLAAARSTLLPKRA
jgi:F-type H+-transporting ATPase subunit b